GVDDGGDVQWLAEVYNQVVRRLGGLAAPTAVPKGIGVAIYGMDRFAFPGLEAAGGDDGPVAVAAGLGFLDDGLDAVLRGGQPTDDRQLFLAGGQQTQHIGERGGLRPDDILVERARAAAVGADTQGAGRQREHGVGAAGQVNGVFDGGHDLVCVGQGGDLEGAAVSLGHQGGQAFAGEGRPTDVFVVAAFHRFGVGGHLLTYAAVIDPHVEA